MAVTTSHRFEPSTLTIAGVVIQVGTAVVLRAIHLAPREYGIVGVGVFDDDALVVAETPERV